LPGAVALSLAPARMKESDLWVVVVVVVVVVLLGPAPKDRLLGDEPVDVGLGVFVAEISRALLHSVRLPVVVRHCRRPGRLSPAVIVVDHSVDIDLIAQLSQEADGEPTRAEETSRGIPVLAGFLLEGSVFLLELVVRDGVEVDAGEFDLVDELLLQPPQDFAAPLLVVRPPLHHRAEAPVSTDHIVLLSQ